MRKWGKQGFLNSADSNDDGWYKFSIRPKVSKGSLEVDIQFMIADCSNKVYLDFEPDYLTLEDDGSLRDVERAKAALKGIDRRIKKARSFADAVVDGTRKIEEALLEYEALIQKALDKSK